MTQHIKLLREIEYIHILRTYESIDGYHTVGYGSRVKLFHNDIEIPGCFSNTYEAMVYAIAHYLTR